MFIKTPRDVAIGSLAAWADMVLSVLATPATAQYLVGADRASFIAGVSNSCLRGRDSDPEMKVILLLYFQQYCTCYGSGLADRLTKREIETGSDAVTGPVIREVSRTCYAMIKAAAMKELEGRKQPQWHGYLFDNSAAKNDPAEALTS